LFPSSQDARILSSVLLAVFAYCIGIFLRYQVVVRAAFPAIVHTEYLPSIFPDKLRVDGIFWRSGVVRDHVFGPLFKPGGSTSVNGCGGLAGGLSMMRGA